MDKRNWASHLTLLTATLLYAVLAAAWIAVSSLLPGWVGVITLFAAIILTLLLLHLWRQQQQIHDLAVRAERSRADSMERQFLELPFIGIAIISPQGKQWLQFNERLCEILGHPCDELAQMCWADMTHPDDLDADMAEFDKVMCGESDGYTMDKRFLRKDGSLVDAYVDVQCVRKQDGSVDHFVAMVQDIGERKEYERQLEEARHKAQQYLDIAGVMLLSLDTTGRIQLINPRACNILGYQAEELHGRDWFEYCLPESVKTETRRVFDSLIREEGEQVEYIEQPVLTRDGEERLIAWHNTLIRDEQGAITATLSSGEDITERKKADARIAHLSQLYATLSRTNQSIVRCHDEEELFDAACSNAVIHGDFKMAWIGLLDEKSGAIKPVARHGDDTGYLERIRLSVDPDGPQGSDPIGTTIREGKSYWCQDFLHAEAIRPWHKPAAAAGFAASAALPLHRDGKVIGSFNLYADKVGAFDQATRELLQEMTTDIDFALEHFERAREQRETEERLELVIKGSKDAPWDWDLEQDRFWYSPQSWARLGYAVDELPADSQLWRKLCHPDDLTAMDETLACIMQPGNRWEEVECRFRHKDGHYIPTLIRGIASRDEHDKVVRLSGTTMDLTERKKTEDQLRRQRDQLFHAKQILDSHLDNSLVGVIEWDPEFRIIRWSGRAESIFGWREEEVLGKHPSEFPFVHEEDAEQVGRVIEALGSGEQEQSHSSNRNHTRDGSVVYTEWYSSALRDEDGKLVSILSLAQDITERQQAQQQLRQRVDELNRWYEATLGREERILELKQEINQLLEQTRQPPRYPSAETQTPANKPPKEPSA